MKGRNRHVHSCFYMQDIWIIWFTCLLVCRSAIFIDSKRGGNRAAPWQEGKTMSTPSVTILKNLVLNWKSNQMEEETIATFYRQLAHCGIANQA